MLETGIDVPACQYGHNEQVKIKVLFSGPYGCKSTILGRRYHVRRTFKLKELLKTLGRNRTQCIWFGVRSISDGGGTGSPKHFVTSTPFRAVPRPDLALPTSYVFI